MRATRLHGWIAATVLFIAGNAWGLAPDDIVVLFNTNSPNSLGIARYYMMARKIPANHLLPVTCDTSDAIAEDVYRNSIVPQVRKGLQDHNLLASVKCLVTVYGIPLKIQARQPTPAEQREIQEDK